MCEGQGVGDRGQRGGPPVRGTFRVPLSVTHEVTHLQMCSSRREGRGHGDTVLAMQYTPLCT